jgi:hypothetical protein
MSKKAPAAKSREDLIHDTNLNVRHETMEELREIIRYAGAYHAWYVQIVEEEIKRRENERQIRP